MTIARGGTAHGPLRSYGRRHGHRLRDARARLVDTLLPRLRVFPAGADADDPPPVDPRALFAMPVRALWLEIGFGGGEHLAAEAAAHPDVGFIGCEPFINGVASLLRYAEAAGLANLRIHDGDARPLIAALPEASVDRVYLLFPDPWPKVRHHKRRLVSPAFLDALARVMADGGTFVFASDHAGYATWTLERLIRHPLFSWTARSRRDWQRPVDWIETRYEAKALAAGRTCIHLRALRRPRP